MKKKKREKKRKEKKTKENKRKEIKNKTKQNKKQKTKKQKQKKPRKKTQFLCLFFLLNNRLCFKSPSRRSGILRGGGGRGGRHGNNNKVFLVVVVVFCLCGGFGGVCRRGFSILFIFWVCMGFSYKMKKMLIFMGLVFDVLYDNYHQFLP